MKNKIINYLKYYTTLFVIGVVILAVIAVFGSVMGLIIYMLSTLVWNILGWYSLLIFPVSLLVGLIANHFKIIDIEMDQNI